MKLKCLEVPMERAGKVFKILISLCTNWSSSLLKAARLTFGLGTRHLLGWLFAFRLTLYEEMKIIIFQSHRFKLYCHEWQTSSSQETNSIFGENQLSFPQKKAFLLACMSRENIFAALVEQISAHVLSPVCHRPCNYCLLSNELQSQKLSRSTAFDKRHSTSKRTTYRTYFPMPSPKEEI